MSELDQVAPEIPTQDVSPAQETQAPASPEPEAKQETPEEQTKRALSGVQRRINELTRERHEERERREQAERRAQELEQYVQQQRMQSAEPKPEQFNDYNEYVKAQARYEAQAQAQQIVREQLSQVLPHMQAQQNAVQARQAEQAAIGQVIQKGKEKYPDFIQAIESAPVDITANPAAYRAVLMSPQSADLSYYLAKNPLEAQEIVASDAMTAVMRLGQLTAKLQNKRVSNAPPPVSTVGGSRTAVEKQEWEMTPKEWKAYMDKKGK